MDTQPANQNTLPPAPMTEEEYLKRQYERVINNEYYQPTKITVMASHPEAGIGVFATSDIVQGEIIERCPMIELGFRSRYHADPQLSKYVYNDKTCDCMQCKIHGHHMYMVLGYGMLYNHSDEPTTNWEFNYANLIADVVAVKDISAGSEIFVSYGKKYFSKRKYIPLDEKSIE
jgi:SET domain-containing protein